MLHGFCAEKMWVSTQCEYRNIPEFLKSLSGWQNTSHSDLEISTDLKQETKDRPWHLDLRVNSLGQQQEKNIFLLLKQISCWFIMLSLETIKNRVFFLPPYCQPQGIAAKLGIVYCLHLLNNFCSHMFSPCWLLLLLSAQCCSMTHGAERQMTNLSLRTEAVSPL